MFTPLHVYSMLHAILRKLLVYRTLIWQLLVYLRIGTPLKKDPFTGGAKIRAPIGVDGASEEVRRHVGAQKKGR